MVTPCLLINSELLPQLLLVLTVCPQMTLLYCFEPGFSRPIFRSSMLLHRRPIPSVSVCCIMIVAKWCKIGLSLSLSLSLSQMPLRVEKMIFTNTPKHIQSAARKFAWPTIFQQFFSFTCNRLLALVALQCWCVIKYIALHPWCVSRGDADVSVWRRWRRRDQLQS